MTSTSQPREIPTVELGELERNISGRQDDADSSHISQPSREDQSATAPPVTSTASHSVPRHLHSGKTVTEWRSWKIRPLALCVLIAFNIGLVVGVVVLLVLSMRRKGFVPVGNPTFSIGSHSVNKGLLWTVLPSLIFLGFRISFDAVVTASSERQPFIELRQPHGAPAKKSVLLDYGAEMPIIREWKAGKNRHFLLLCSFVLSFLLIFTTAFSSRLIYESETRISNLQDFRLTRELNLGTQNVYGLNDIEGPGYIAEAVTTYGGHNIPWTTSTHAFLPFLLPSSPAAFVATTHTTASSAPLTCTAHDLLPLAGGSDKLQQGGYIQINGTNPSCPWTFTLRFTVLEAYYMETFFEKNCYDYEPYPRRLILIAAFIDETVTIRNLSALSCYPTYLAQNGSLTVSIDGTKTPQIESFVPVGNAQEMSPDWAPGVEMAIFDSTLNDPGSITATNFGRLVLQYGRNQNWGAAFMVPENLRHAAKVIWAAYFAAVASSLLMQPTKSSSAPLIHGDVTMIQTRLFVTKWIAGTTIGILSCTMVVLICMAIYHHRHKSILYEEPKSLMAIMGILLKSDLVDVATEARQPRNGPIEQSPPGRWTRFWHRAATPFSRVPFSRRKRQSVDEKVDSLENAEFNGKTLGSVKRRKMLDGKQFEFSDWETPVSARLKLASPKEDEVKSSSANTSSNGNIIEPDRGEVEQSAHQDRTGESLVVSEQPQRPEQEEHEVHGARTESDNRSEQEENANAQLADGR